MNCRSNESIIFENFSFSYPGNPVLKDISLRIGRGEFAVLCGPSGCGKTTLIRQLKPAIAPCGERSGSIYIDGCEIGKIDLRTQTEKIGFVRQSPETQLVTDKVWHELAFGMESLGYDTPTIRQRTAEMAQFFGIEGWFYRNVAELSGGQKQLLNLAAVMTMAPEILILDEPTGQLDPIAASAFINELVRINHELGVTVLLIEQRLEETLYAADRVIVMNEGKILCNGDLRSVGSMLREAGEVMFKAMPVPMRVWAHAGDGSGSCPVTAAQGRNWMHAYAQNHTLYPVPERGERTVSEDIVIEARDIWFRYERNGQDILKGFSMQLRRGEFAALLGGNGSGKSTALRLLSAVRHPYRGETVRKGRIAVLPQNPQTLFVRRTVRDELSDVTGDEAAVRRMVRLCHLEALMERDPFDLSGGESQRTALAKILLTDPETVFLDEPTKGMDAGFKEELSAILRDLLGRGIAVLMVTHDVEFAAEYADRCMLLFDGCIVSEGSPRQFFSRNHFYTTAVNRMAGDLVPLAVTAEDLICVCTGENTDMQEEVHAPCAEELAEAGGRMAGLQEEAQMSCAEELAEAGGGMAGLREEKQMSCAEELIASGCTRAGMHEDKHMPCAEDIIRDRYAEDAAADHDSTGGTHHREKDKLPVWKKVVTGICFLIIIVVMIAALTMNDLNTVISDGQLTSVSGKYIALYAVMIAAMLVLACILSRKGSSEIDVKTSRGTGGISKGTLLAIGAVFVCIPATVFFGTHYLGSRKYYITSIVVLLECMLPLIAAFEGRRPKARELVLIAALSAVGVIGRIAFGMLPGFNPVSAITIISGIALGGEVGFVVGAVTMLVSNFVFAQGPWTPWQMCAMGLVGMLSGMFFRTGIFRRTRTAICLFGAVTAIVIYGAIMNTAAALIWQNNITRGMLFAYYLIGLPMDLINASATAIFLWIGAEPMIEKLERIKIKYGLI